MGSKSTTASATATLLIVNSSPATLFHSLPSMLSVFRHNSSSNNDNNVASGAGFDKLHPMHERLHALINGHRIMVFLTGTPSEPRCGFTMRMVELLDQLPIDFDRDVGFFDIMTDDDVCEGLKSYSWPTYPQLYIDGELIGGYDITRQMTMDGSLINLLSKKGLLAKKE